MSNVINFSAREFRFDKTCEDNTGIRAVITTSQGNTEAYEIGDWRYSVIKSLRKTQIISSALQ